MSKIDKLLKEATKLLQQYPYYKKCHILNRGKSYVKFRLVITKDLFVQINRNELALITNLALINQSKRIYGRDEYRTHWHRHPSDNPSSHNFSEEGVDRGGIFSELKDEEYFKRFFIDLSTVCWPNGADVAPERLYELGQPIES